MTQEDLDKLKQDLEDEKAEIESKIKKFNLGFSFSIIIAIILILLLVFGCTPSKEDYVFKVTKVVEVNDCQVVTFANSFDYYTLWLPLEPKYKVGQIIDVK